MPPKAKADARQEVLVAPQAAFGIPPDFVEKFCRRATVHPSDLMGGDPGDRYVLISVDPAGGGFLSEEAFIVWLISGGTFALFSGRSVKGHKPGYHYTTVPLIFVVSLLETIRQVRAALSELHGPFTMPEVIVLLETNFAYGAAVYMQTLFFLEKQRQQIPDLQDVVITFATPVYLWNVSIANKRDELNMEKQRKDTLVTQYQEAKARFETTWVARPLYLGDKGNIMQEIRKQYHIDMADADFDVQQIASLRVEEVVQEVLKQVVANIKDSKKKIAEAAMQAFEGYLYNELQPLFVNEQMLRRQIQVANKTITQLKAQIRELVNDGIPQAGTADHFRAKQWPEGLKEVDGAVVFEHDDLFWNAPKSLLGVTTTLREKIRAFQHWVHIMTATVPRMKIVRTGQATHPFDPNAPPCDGISRELGAGVEGKLVHPWTVMHCVYEQWRNLQVYVDAADRRSILRIKGKAMMTPGAGEGEDNVARDDVWMAFSIGLQWCSCFTRVLPNAASRRSLVQYMRGVREKVNHAIQQCLRDAAMSDAAPPDAPVVRPVAFAAPPPALPADDVIDALVAVAAMVRAIELQCDGLRDVTRRIIMSCAAQGLVAHSGFRVRVRRVERRRDLLRQRAFWKQKVGEQLRREGDPVGSAAFSTAFGVTSSTLRIASAPPYSGTSCWPGIYRKERAVLSVPVEEFLSRMAGHLETLERMCMGMLPLHAPLHTVLKHPGTSNLPVLILQRLRSVCDNLTVIVQDMDADTILKMASISPLTQLAGWYHDRLPPPPDAATIPMTLFTAYLACTEELLFLRKLYARDRKELISILEQVPAKQWECKSMPPHNADGDPSLPRPVAKLSQRKIVNWKRAFEVTWPHEFAHLEPIKTEEGVKAEPGTAEEPTRVTVVFQSFISFDVNHQSRPTFLSRSRVRHTAPHADADGSMVAGSQRPPD